MKNTIFRVSALVFVLAFILGGCSLYSSTPNKTAAPIDSATPINPAAPVVETPAVSESNVAISIKEFAFNPATITIKKGTTVTWTNNDSAPHQIKSDSFNSDVLKQGQKYLMNFGDAGVFNYSCSIHPSMTGQIIVE